MALMAFGDSARGQPGPDEDGIDKGELTLLELAVVHSLVQVNGVFTSHDIVESGSLFWGLERLVGGSLLGAEWLIQHASLLLDVLLSLDASQLPASPCSSFHCSLHC